MEDNTDILGSERIVEVTDALLERGKSSRGGWSREQLQCLGVRWPLRDGWRRALLGRRVERRAAEAFLRLRAGPEAVPPLAPLPETVVAVCSRCRWVWHVPRCLWVARPPCPNCTAVLERSVSRENCIAASRAAGLSVQGRQSEGG
jgi:hypothetical protein